MSVGLASISAVQSATHSLQMYTPGPATIVSTSAVGFTHNEQMTDHRALCAARRSPSPALPSTLH